MTVLVIHEDEDGNSVREFLVEPGEEFGTDLGVLEVPEDIQPGETLETHLGTEFRVRRLRGPDLFHHFERTGAPMVPRDVGLVIGETGVCQGDRVLDAGTGTGVLAASMARAGATVTTYERDPEFAEVARENMALANVAESVEVRAGNVLEDLDELVSSETGPNCGVESDESERESDTDAETDSKTKTETETDEDAETNADADTATDGSFDVLTLDTGDAASVVERAPELLVKGGFLAVYSPFIESTREVVATARDVGLSEITTRETIQREMDFDDRGSRPSTAPVGHTGYLTIARND
ncbi:methyltransferase domain-containing protein [Natronoglomus mannanivorans]|uniref:50S ribosomal protein L11 methyltransferase n=1 Tax=Natronoglomus mannanivorans TaxID=2979990 RepID=A0AAP3E2C1_9EURY|nr:50S ribosomal protein L11 methyltransferase [Halobacteria archaeon AArc-xg1-1]